MFTYEGFLGTFFRISALPLLIRFILRLFLLLSPLDPLPVDKLFYIIRMPGYQSLDFNGSANLPRVSRLLYRLSEESCLLRARLVATVVSI